MVGIVPDVVSQAVGGCCCGLVDPHIQRGIVAVFDLHFGGFSVGRVGIGVFGIIASGILRGDRVIGRQRCFIKRYAVVSFTQTAEEVFPVGIGCIGITRGGTVFVEFHIDTLNTGLTSILDTVVVGIVPDIVSQAVGDGTPSCKAEIVSMVIGSRVSNICRGDNRFIIIPVHHTVTVCLGISALRCRACTLPCQWCLCRYSCNNYLAMARIVWLQFINAVDMTCGTLSICII